LLSLISQTLPSKESSASTSPSERRNDDVPSRNDYEAVYFSV